MVAPQNFAFTFRGLAVHRADRVFLTAGHDESDEKRLRLSFILRWAGQWTSKGLPYNLTGVCPMVHPKPHVLILDLNGDIVRWENEPVEEKVDPGPEGPPHVGDLKDIRCIGQHAYVAGMRRMVYRCDAPRVWTRIDQGVRCGPNDQTSAGFMAIHGFDEKEIYAGGWEGEIWQYDGKKWRKREIPTNLAFFTVLCAPDGNVYAAGQRGTLFVGRQDRWTLLEHEETQEDFYGSAWFKGQAYFSTPNGIFAARNGALEKVDIKPKGGAEIKFVRNLSFARLSASEDVLWSAGSKMLLHTDDGKTWTEPPYQ